MCLFSLQKADQKISDAYAVALTLFTVIRDTMCLFSLQKADQKISDAYAVALIALIVFFFIKCG